MVKSIISEALERNEEEQQKAAVLEGKVSTVSTSPDDEELKKIIEGLQVSIKIFGCGGGGCNTINRCWDAGISGAQMAAANTDAKHLLTVHANRKFLIGRRTTKGLGAGAIPQVGEEATRENEGDIRQYLSGSNIVFVTAGMGGGTGTGSSPMVAKIAKEAGALVMGVVTMPFKAEGAVRMQNAEWGLERLARVADTVITIPNDKLLELVPRLPLDQAFKVADEILMTCIKGITEIITKPGLVNLDYSDIMTIMKGGGVAMVGLGESEDGTDKVSDAVAQALSSPLLGEIDITHAKGALIRVIGGPDMTVSEAQKAAELVSSKLSPSARIIWGCSIEHDLERHIKVLLILTGVKGKYFVGKDSESGGYSTAEGLDEVK
jgi:cell division protein FtsZ